MLSHGMALLGLCIETFFPCTIRSYPGQPPPLMHFVEPAIWPSSIRTEDPTCANNIDVLTVRMVFPSNVNVNILRGLPC